MMIERGVAASRSVISGQQGEGEKSAMVQRIALALCNPPTPEPCGADLVSKGTESAAGRNLGEVVIP